MQRVVATWIYGWPAVIVVKAAVTARSGSIWE